jgi:hypothetical protein
MKSRTVIILWIIAIILGVSVYFVKKSASGVDKNATNRTPGQTLLADFPADKAANIEISGATQSVSLVKKDGKWTVAQRDGFPANSRNINELLRTLAELKVAQGVEAGPSFAPRFGMDALPPFSRMPMARNLQRYPSEKTWMLRHRTRPSAVVRPGASSVTMPTNPVSMPSPSSSALSPTMRKAGFPMSSSRSKRSKESLSPNRARMKTNGNSPAPMKMPTSLSPRPTQA